MRFGVSANASTVVRCGMSIQGRLDVVGPCDSVTTEMPLHHTVYAIAGWVEATEFPRATSASVNKRTDPRLTRLTDTYVPFAPEPRCVVSGTKPCANKVDQQSAPYQFSAMCQRRGGNYYRNGSNANIGYANLWIQRTDGNWAPNLWTDAMNAGADQPDPTMPQC